jgi:hypothetical protein
VVRANVLRAARLCGAIALTLLAAACSTDVASYSTIVTQDKYDFMACEQILQSRIGLNAREKDLSGLIEKASSSPGGIVASFAAYRSELAQTRAQIVAVDRAVKRNNCDAPKKP